ncbi:hypothetical protein EXS70_02600 [Candidatus Peribacteria bacterium]|nr:hypothetical protein [Candidatus Peribacteria bacterium]
MRIFALETNIEKLNQSFLSPGEHIVLKARFHGFLFFVRALWATFLTIVIIAIGVGATMSQIPASLSSPVLFIAWLYFVALSLLRSFIDWRYDELIVTNEKIIFVNQSSIIQQEIKQMNLENLASVKALTQYGGIFPFGKLHFDLKEGVGAGLKLRFIPNAQRACSQISDCIVQFQRRQAN